MYSFTHGSPNHHHPLQLQCRFLQNVTTEDFQHSGALQVGLYYYYYYFRQQGYVIIVYLFVRLLATLRKKNFKGFPWNFQGRLTMANEQSSLAVVIIIVIQCYSGYWGSNAQKTPDEGILFRRILKVLVCLTECTNSEQHTTVLGPFLGLQVSRCQKKSSSGLYGAKGDIRGRHTDNMAGHHYVWTNQRPTCPIPPFLCRMSFLLQPSQFILSWARYQICWLAYSVAWIKWRNKIKNNWLTPYHWATVVKTGVYVCVRLLYSHLLAVHMHTQTRWLYIHFFTNWPVLAGAVPKVSKQNPWSLLCILDHTKPAASRHWTNSQSWVEMSSEHCVSLLEFDCLWCTLTSCNCTLC